MENGNFDAELDKTKNQSEDRVICERNPKLIADLIADVAKMEKWASRENISIVKLDGGSTEYKLISERFYKMDAVIFAKFVNIISIERIENPAFMAAYKIKIAQLREKAPRALVDIRTMFHATSRKVCEKISREGFDWRLAGTKIGAIWGQGISFSPIPHITMDFSVPENGVYSMVMCHMPLRKTAINKPHLKLPDNGFDSTHSPDKTVFVNFDDFTVYPKYIISIMLTPDYIAW